MTNRNLSGPQRQSALQLQKDMATIKDAMQSLPKPLGNAILNIVAKKKDEIANRHRQQLIASLGHNLAMDFRQADRIRDVTDEISRALIPVIQEAIFRNNFSQSQQGTGMGADFGLDNRLLSKLST